jgi:hypothetical protein
MDQTDTLTPPVTAVKHAWRSPRPAGVRRDFRRRRLAQGHSAILFAFGPFSVSPVMGLPLSRNFSLGPQDFSSFRRLPVTLSPPIPRRCGPSLQQVCDHPCCLRQLLNGSTTGPQILTMLARRSLPLQPGNLLISPRLTLSIGFNMSISLRAATQAWRLLALSAAGLPSSSEGHPMDHDSNSAGHINTQARPQVPTPFIK